MRVNVMDEASIQDAIKHLKKLQTGIQSITTEALVETATEVGQPVAEGLFADAIERSDHPEDWTMPSVSVEREGNTVKLLARGEDVGFLEFGTGYFNPEYSMPGFPPHGSYGQHRGMQTAWYYKDGEGQRKRTHGIEPSEAMLTAAQEMTAHLRERLRKAMEE